MNHLKTRLQYGLYIRFGYYIKFVVFLALYVNVEMKGACHVYIFEVRITHKTLCISTHDEKRKYIIWSKKLIQ